MFIYILKYLYKVKALSLINNNHMLVMLNIFDTQKT